MSVDPSEHIGMLHHVVQSATLNMPDFLKDEALSEGLVLLTQAAQSFDYRHRVPPGHWIAIKLRWGLLNWRNREAYKHGMDQYIEDSPEELMREVLEDAEAALALRELLIECQARLPADVYLALVGPAYGLHMKELSHMLKANPNQIKALQIRGRKLIMEMKLL